MVDIPVANLVSPGERLLDGTILRALLNQASSVFTSFSFVNANGISGSVTNPTTTAALTLSLGAITPTSIVASGSIAGSNLSGSNTGDQTIILTGAVTGSGTGSFATTYAGTVPASKGGTGIVNNDLSTITISGNFGTTFTITGTTSITLPTSGTLVNTGVTTLSSLISIGTIGTGVWQGTAVGSAYGGTGVNNGASTITLGGSLVTSGAFGTTITVTNTTNSTLPAGTKTLVSTDSSVIAFTGGTIDGATLGATTPMQIQGFRPVNTQTGTSYTLVLGDSGKEVTMNNGSASTLTIPPHASVAFVVQTEVDLFQLGAGQVTVTAGAGVTIISYTTKVKLAGQYAGATIKQTATQDTWSLVGNLA